MALSQTFKLKYGPWALVTGASKGLGAEFARQIGGKGLNLVLVARGRDELAQVKEEVRKHSNVEVKTVVADLSRPDFMEALRRETDGLDVGLLVCNAAQPLVGLFFEQSLEVKLKTVEVNCRAVLILVHEYGGRCWPESAAESSCFRRDLPCRAWPMLPATLLPRPTISYWRRVFGTNSATTA